jgi:hypothetical protein
LGLTHFPSYFFSGLTVVLAAGEAAGLALVSTFLLSTFFSSFTGLAVGAAVDVGLAVVTGEAVVGEADGVELADLFSGALEQAPRNAAMAAKTVSRIDLLMFLFPF